MFRTRLFILGAPYYFQKPCFSGRSTIHVAHALMSSWKTLPTELQLNKAFLYTLNMECSVTSAKELENPSNLVRTWVLNSC